MLFFASLHAEFSEVVLSPLVGILSPVLVKPLPVLFTISERVSLIALWLRCYAIPCQIPTNLSSPSPCGLQSRNGSCGGLPTSWGFINRYLSGELNPCRRLCYPTLSATLATSPAATCDEHHPVAASVQETKRAMRSTALGRLRP